MAVQELTTSRVGAILRSTSGNFLEQFDFFLFGFYASSIAKVFFPTVNEANGLMLTFTTFWLGALMRPIGAVFLGAYIDSIGRRRGLIVTLGIMAMGTILIAVTPGYQTIGLAAPVIVLAGRLLQGFSAGVELGGVSIYLFEIAKPGQKGFITSFQSGSQQVSIVFAALLGYGLSQSMADETIAAWGWRIPFFVGCAIVPLIFVLRRSLVETPEFLARAHHPTGREVLATTFQNAGIVLWGMLLVAMTTVTFYFTTVYSPTFGGKVLKLDAEAVLLVTLLTAVTNFLWLPVGGAVSDRIGRKPVLLATSALAFLTAYPALSWLGSAPSFSRLLLVQMLLSFCFGTYNGAMVVSLSEVVPPIVRTTCFSVAYALAAALFGTFTPLVGTWLFKQTGDRASAGYWLMAAAACGFVATVMIYRAGTRRSAAVAEAFQ